MDKNANQTQEQERIDRLNSLPAMMQALVDDIQNQRERLDAFEERESSRALNPDRVTVIALEKMVDHLAEIVQTLVAEMQSVKTTVDALETRESTRTLNTDRVRIIDLEKRFDQLVENLSKSGGKN